MGKEKWEETVFEIKILIIMDKVKQLADALYNQKILEGWENVSTETCLKRATDYYRMDEVVKKIMTNLIQCKYCGIGGFTIPEITDGQCPTCFERQEYECECECIEMFMTDEGWLVCDECGLVVC
jgi:hypothetical protein